MARVPKGARVGLAGARSIAADPAMLRAASAFWRQAYTDLGVPDLAAIAHDAITLGRSTPDDWISDLLPERDLLWEGCPDDFVVKRSGCLVALEELASTVTPTRRGDVLLECVEGLLAVDTGAPITPDAAACGLIGVRELYDAMRRYDLVRDLSAEFNIPFAELLALYRQESGLGISPPEVSWAHAPLIRTGWGCRDDKVTLGFDPTCARPGFNIGYLFREALDAIATDASIRFDIAFRNVLVVAGGDTIMLPRLGSRDELSQLFRMASAAGASPDIATLASAYRGHLARVLVSAANHGEGKSQRVLFDETCMGILRTLLETSRVVPSADDLLSRTRLNVDALLAAHPYQPAKPWRGKDVSLRATADPGDTYECLRLQARWYASRRNATTLYSWEDRAPVVGNDISFTPYLSYLRFHTGDAIFVGLILRVLTRFDELIAGWTKNAARWGTALIDVSPGFVLDAATIADLRESLRTHWGTRRVRTSTTWQHIGLVEALHSQPGAPAWLAPPRAPDASLVRTAAVARSVVEALTDPGVLRAVATALELTPAAWLVKRGFRSAAAGEAANIYAKAHSFERLRLVYEKAVSDAGL